jgi:hypothetical protein
MDDKKKKKIFNKVVSRIFLFLLIAFTALYVSEATGYYEFEQHKKTELNKIKIQQFEEDVKNGKDINIKDYIDEVEISYENGISTVGYALSEKIGDVVECGLEAAFTFFGKLFNG